MAAASATGWTSYERAITHSADAAAKTSDMLTSSATATATVVYPPSSSKKSERPRRKPPCLDAVPGTASLAPRCNPITVVTPNPLGPRAALDLGR